MADLCASVQEAIVEVLVTKTVRAASKYEPTGVCIVGGVSANLHLQETMQQAIRLNFSGVRMLQAARGLHTDNAAMIAAAGAWHLLKGEKHDWRKLDARAEWDL